MSLPGRGRGRGSSRGTRQSTATRTPPTNTSNTNGNVPSGPARRGFASGAPRGSLWAAGRGHGAQTPRGRGAGRGGTAGATFTKPDSRRAANGGAMSGGPLKDRYEKLKKVRELERRDAEKKGIVSAPGQARQLSDAVTPVGTCQDMCAEWERVERAFQNNVAPEELDPDQSAYAPGLPVPMETRMVKKFRRPGVGDGDQLPSDLRPPGVLKTTLDYLFGDLLTNAPSLASVHGFIWDRTRAIRNDFSIQQVTKLDDVRIAIECFERIARFHILTLHKMATPEARQQGQKAETVYDPQQEREQLDRTLLSLMQYYDDYRGRLDLFNEAEFRSYCVIFQLDSSDPDTEDRVQTWPRGILYDRQIQNALELFAAACTAFRRRGPFKNLATEHVIARQDWERFWQLMNSNKISYLQACVAEIYFHLMRDMILKSIVRAMRPGKPVAGKLAMSTEWSITNLQDLLKFDDEEQLVAFCALYDLEFHQVGDDEYLDVSSVAGKTLQTPTFAKSIQESSWIVEQKRHGRAFSAVIDGMGVQQALSAGLIDESEGKDEMEDAAEDQEASETGEEDPESLFIPEAQKPSNAAFPKTFTTAPPLPGASLFGQPTPAPSTLFGQTSAPPEPTKPSVFGQPSPSGGSSSLFGHTGVPPEPTKPSIFGQPSSGSPSSQPSGFGKPTQQTSAFNFNPPKPAVPNEMKSTFNFSGLSAPTESPAATAATSTTSAFPSMTAQSLFPPQGPSSTTNSQAGASNKSAAQLFGSPFAKPASSDASSLFAKPAASDAASLFAPRENATASTSPANSFTAATSYSNPFAPTTITAPTTTSKETPPTPTFSFSQPEPTQKVPSVFGAPAAPSTATPDAANSKSAAAQASLPAQTQQLPSSPSTSHSGQEASASALNAGSQSPPRRTSINNLPDTKPKKPSPLSNSFTFSEDNSSLGGAPRPSLTTPKQPAEELFPGRQKTGLPPSFTQANAGTQSAVNQQTSPSFDAVLTRIADELTTDPACGFLKQYVEFTVKQVITKTQERLYRERMNKEADEFRTWFLQDKFGKKWRDTCRRQRLAKQGRERRQRAQRRLHESQTSDARYNGRTSNTAPSLASSRAGSVASHQNRREMVDAMYKSTMGGSRFLSDRQAQAGSKRPMSSEGPESALPSAASGHKRMKSTSHVDDGGRITKPLTTNNANADLLKRSSFLNFSLASNAPSHSSTTKSTYFRMKALGVKQSPEASLKINRGMKRQRSESLGIDNTPRSSRLSSSPLGSSSSQPRERSDGLMRPPATRSVKSRTNDDDDDALFARLKAAREGLMESGSFMRSEMEKDSELRLSGSSLSDRDSPSLARARAEVLRQSAQADSDFGASLSGRKVPAYRLRESRFVPKEDYPRALERANEIMASRSEQASKAEPRADPFDFDAALESSINTDARFAQLPQPSREPPTINGMNGISAPSGLFSKAAPAVQPSGGFGPPQSFGFGAPSFDSFALQPPQLTAPAPPTVNGARNPFLEDSYTQDSQNPFLQAPVTNGPLITQSQTNVASTAPSQPAYNFGFGNAASNASLDNTVQPSQIDHALSQSFGQPRSGYSNLSGPAPSQAVLTQPSHAAPQAISLMSDDGGDDEEATGNATYMGFHGSGGPQSYKTGSVNLNASVNPFAALAGTDESSDSDADASEEGDEPKWNGAVNENLGVDDDQTEEQPDSYQYDDGATEEYGSDNGEDHEDDVEVEGNTNEGYDYGSDDGAEDAEDEDDYDSEEGSYDEDDDDEDGRPFVPQAAFGRPPLQANPALQVVGNNVEEAIELSD